LHVSATVIKKSGPSKRNTPLKISSWATARKDTKNGQHTAPIDSLNVCQNLRWWNKQITKLVLPGTDTQCQKRSFSNI